MSCCRIIAALTLLMLMVFIGIVNASVPEDAADVLLIRAGSHSGFFRIVFEGRDDVISKGKVSLKGRDVIVNFPDTNFSLENKKLKVNYRIDKDAVTFFMNRNVELKSYSLNNPSRLVIDLYQKKEDAKQKTTPAPAIKKENETTVKESPAEPKEKYVEVQKNKKDASISEKDPDEKDLIPGRYKAIWNLFEAGNFYAVLKELPNYKPDDAGSLAAFYYIFARANETAKQYSDAVKHLRLAYIYAANDALKERALLKRADIYLNAGLFYEARADYLIFIRDYPGSRYIRKAQFGLAESLSKIDFYSEAVEHYEQAGETPEVLFGMANALQKLEKIKEAERTYDKAMGIDENYPKKSPETKYLMGENMRLSGNIEGAKKQLSSIEFGTFKDKASISLGLIAVDESVTGDAIRSFKSVANSKDPELKVSALFNLSLAFIKQGNFKDAISSLEEIRHKHIDSYLYKDTLLVLSKLYRKVGKMRESVSLLKELVYGKQPPEEAFGELEDIVLETGNSPDQGGIRLVNLWNEVGQWLVDTTREEFLVKVAKKLRHEGKPFLDLSTWLVENASVHAKGKAAVDLAEYYDGVGDIDMSRKYLNIAKESNESGDAVLRVEAKILRASGDHTSALRKIISIKEIGKEDLEQLGGIISGMEDMTSKEAQGAIAFYKKKLDSDDWDAGLYVSLADILYNNNDEDKALEYYRIAYQKNPDDQWTLYRLGRGAGRPESKDMLSRLEKDNTVLGSLAKTRLMEMSLMNRVDEIY